MNHVLSFSMKNSFVYLHCLFFGIIQLSSLQLKGQVALEMPDSISLYEDIYNSKSIPELTLETDTKNLIRHSKSEKYQPAQVNLKYGDAVYLEIHAAVRARGNVRKEVCEIPPIKINLSRKQLDSLGYLKIDKLKLLLPCVYDNQAQQYLYKEHFLYQAYELLDSNALRSKITKVQVTKNGKLKYKFNGLLLEDEKAYAQRKQAKIVQSNNINQGGLDRTSFLRMMFFQYMIGNTDWGIPTSHNIEMVKLPETIRVVPLPYDFDYSGFVNQPYAVPNDEIPIKNVRERYFFSYKISDAEYDAMVQEFSNIESSIMQLLDRDEFLNEETKRDCTYYLNQFFNALKDPATLKPKIQRKK